MTLKDFITLIVAFVGVVSVSAVFTILYSSFINSTAKDIEIGKKDIELIDEVIYFKQEKVKKRKKVFSIIKSTILYTLIAIMIPIFIVSAINKFSGNRAMIGDKTFMAVGSASMSFKNEKNDYLFDENNIEKYNLDNQFQTYDIIILTNVRSDSDLELYDVIAFWEEGKSAPTIHRIINISTRDGVLTYTTKGDANENKDPSYRTLDDIVGKYTSKRIRGVGIFIIFFQSPVGMITILSVIYCLIMVDRLSKKLKKVQDARVEKLSGVIEQIDDKNVDLIKATYKETIYYKGFAYHFDENGFVSKEEIKDEEMLKQIDNKVIKVKENDDSTKTIDEVVVDEVIENVEEESKGE